MAKEPAKKQIQNLIENLVKSEIPELQSVARELADWTRKLEKHGWQLQQYALQLEELVDKQIGQGKSEVNLAELVKDLESTLIELRKRPGELASAEEPVKEESMPMEMAKPAASAITEMETAEPSEEKEEIQSYGQKSPTPRMTKITGTESGLYRTPEGFLVRKRRP